MKAKTSFSLKDQLFNSEKVAYLADLFVSVQPDFPKEEFGQKVTAEFPNLALKERIAHISTCLHAFLPSDYLEALALILQALPPPLDPNKNDDDFGDFILAPLSYFVAAYGCTAVYLVPSLHALRALTKRFSAEDAIRYFINAFPEETLTFLHDCATDQNYHVRRLASEGTRPKLPWSQKLLIPYHRPLPILDTLFADKTRYVTRSVANHLNDISKLDPDLVIETLTRWQQSQQQVEKEMDFITQHALRTLVKRGHPGALQYLGFGTRPDITITHFSTQTPRVEIGKTLEFSLTIQSNRQQNLLIDYMMTFATEGNKAGQKVFKLKQAALNQGERLTIKKKHPMRLMTTRRLVPGEHKITLQVNGQSFDSLSFDLCEPSA